MNELKFDATAGVGMPEPLSADIKARAEAVAAKAAEHVSTVDRDARFPEEAFAAARAHRLMGIMVPREFSGEGASASDVADVCYVLARGCASTGMIYAMHQTKVACIIRHSRGNPWQERMMRRICSDQLLLASSTTEGQGGGNVRSSASAVTRQGSRISLERNASVISYGEQADGVVTTARRSAEAAPSDQVLVVFPKENYSLERTVGWDTLGMRGTCSEGFTLKATGESDQVLQEPFEKIQMRTMLPVSHLMWSGVWTGVAAGAVDRARSFVRMVARRTEGQLPPGAAHLTRAVSSLRNLRSLVSFSARRFDSLSVDDQVLESLDFQTSMNLLKVNASELAVSTVMSAMQACGLAGYRNDGDFTIGRHLRDILSSPIMISNDRILANVANASLLAAVPPLLSD